MTIQKLLARILLTTVLCAYEVTFSMLFKHMFLQLILLIELGKVRHFFQELTFWNHIFLFPRSNALNTLFALNILLMCAFDVFSELITVWKSHQTPFRRKPIKWTLHLWAVFICSMLWLLMSRQMVLSFKSFFAPLKVTFMWPQLHMQRVNMSLKLICLQKHLLTVWTLILSTFHRPRSFQPRLRIIIYFS